MAFCTNCGSTIGDSDLFCLNCGAQQRAEKVQTRTASPSAAIPPSQPPVGTQAGIYQSPRKFYRSRHDRWVAGVCGGLGKYFNIDPVLIRIAFLFSVFLWGTGLFIYLILAVITPVEP